MLDVWFLKRQHLVRQCRYISFIIVHNGSFYYSQYNRSFIGEQRTKKDCEKEMERDEKNKAARPLFFNKTCPGRFSAPAFRRAEVR